MFREIFLVTMIIVQASFGRTTAITAPGFYVGKGIMARLGSGLEGLQNMTVFSKTPSISITECATACMTRDECSYVYYVRRSTMCYLLKTAESNTEDLGLVDNVLAVVAGAVFGAKAEWQDGHENTSLHTSNAVSTACGTKPYIPNTIRDGNMDNEGAKVVYRCKAAYNPAEFTPVTATCRPGGTWDTVTLQCSGQDIIDRCNTTGSVWLRHKSCYSILGQQFFNYWWAENTCEEYGGHLVSIADQEEQEFIEGMLRKELEKKAYDKPFYIGLYAKSLEEDRWTDGSSVVYENWATNQTQQTFTNCVVIDPAHRFQWVKRECWGSFYTLCEFDLA